MPRLSFRAEDWMADGLDSLVDETSLNKSDLIRRAVRDLLTEWSDSIPDWVQKEASHDEIIKKNRPALRTMHFKQRSFEYILNCLVDERGNLKRFPPHPDKVDAVYIEELRNEVSKEHGDHQEEYMKHIDRLSEWYRLMHPETSDGSQVEQVCELACHYIRFGQSDKARELCKDAEHSGQLPAGTTWQDVMDEARDGARNDRWKHQWEDAVRGGEA